MKDTIIAIITAIASAYIMYDIGRSRGHSKGYQEGYELARGWRDEAIDKYQTMITEVIKQRDEARSTRIVLAPAANPFSSK